QRIPHPLSRYRRTGTGPFDRPTAPTTGNARGTTWLRSETSHAMRDHAVTRGSIRPDRTQGTGVVTVARETRTRVHERGASIHEASVYVIEVPKSAMRLPDPETRSSETDPGIAETRKLPSDFGRRAAETGRRLPQAGGSLPETRVWPAEAGGRYPETEEGLADFGIDVTEPGTSIT